MTELDFIRGYADASRAVSQLRVDAFCEHDSFAWHKLRRIVDASDFTYRTLATDYFADPSADPQEGCAA